MSVHIFEFWRVKEEEKERMCVCVCVCIPSVSETCFKIFSKRHKTQLDNLVIYSSTMTFVWFAWFHDF